LNKITESIKKDYRYGMGYRDGYQKGCAKTLEAIKIIIENSTNPKMEITGDIKVIEKIKKEMKCKI